MDRNKQVSEQKEQKDLNDLMHAETRREISEIKRNAEETLRDFLSLKTEVHSIATNLKNLDERLNEGVSKTAFKTYEKVNEIAVQIKDHEHKNREQDKRMEHIEEKVQDNADSNKAILKWVLGMSSSILLAVIGLAIWIIKTVN